MRNFMGMLGVVLLWVFASSTWAADYFSQSKANFDWKEVHELGRFLNTEAPVVTEGTVEDDRYATYRLREKIARIHEVMTKGHFDAPYNLDLVAVENKVHDYEKAVVREYVRQYYALAATVDEMNIRGNLDCATRISEIEMFARHIGETELSLGLAHYPAILAQWHLRRAFAGIRREMEVGGPKAAEAYWPDFANLVARWSSAAGFSSEGLGLRTDEVLVVVGTGALFYSDNLK